MEKWVSGKFGKSSGRVGGGGGSRFLAPKAPRKFWGFLNRISLIFLIKSMIWRAPGPNLGKGFTRSGSDPLWGREGISTQGKYYLPSVNLFPENLLQTESPPGETLFPWL